MFRYDANAISYMMLLLFLVDCGNLSSPANGGISLNSTLQGSIATYFCLPGFMLSGDEQRVCQSNSTWSGTASTCSRKY